jgi:excisionase family DNA binding protein
MSAFLTIAEVADRLTLSVATVRRLTASGQIPIIRLSARRVAVPTAAVERYLREGGWQSAKTTPRDPPRPHHPDADTAGNGLQPTNGSCTPPRRGRIYGHALGQSGPREMAKEAIMQYIVYTRTESGAIVRVHDRVTLTKAERVADYQHRETLTGWPERAVYWTRATGRAAGVAPLSR